MKSINNRFYIMVIFIMTLSLGNIWNYLMVVEAYQHSEYIIFYILGDFFIVLPIIFLEIFLGYKYKSSIVRLSRNIRFNMEMYGWVNVLSCIIIVCYFITFMAMIINYLFIPNDIFLGDGILYFNRMSQSIASYTNHTNYIVGQGWKTVILFACLSIWLLIFLLYKRFWVLSINIATIIAIPLVLILGAGVVYISLENDFFSTFLSGFGTINHGDSNYIYIITNAFRSAIYSSFIGVGFFISGGSLLKKPPTDKKFWIKCICIYFIIKIMFFSLLYVGIDLGIKDGVVIFDDVLVNHYLSIPLISYAIGESFKSIFMTNTMLYINWTLILIIQFMACLILVISALKTLEGKYNRKTRINSVYYIGILVSLIFASNAGYAYISELAISNLFKIVIWLCIFIELVFIIRFNNSRISLDLEKVIKSDKKRKWFIQYIKLVIPIVLLLVFVYSAVQGVLRMFHNDINTNVYSIGVCTTLIVGIGFISYWFSLDKWNVDYSIDKEKE